LTSPTKGIQLVIFDWAGTTIDFGSRAPAFAFVGIFAAHGIEVTDTQAREPMGLNKREHLIAMLNMPPIAERWNTTHGRDWTEADVDAMYNGFIPIQLESIQKNAVLVPGLLDVVSQIKSRNIKLGGTTGYFQAASDAVLRSAAAASYEPDASACADNVPHGRPAPWMIYRVMEQLNVFPPSSVVKVGDTVADIKAGLAAGCWSIGVCDSSSPMGLSHTEYEALPADEQVERLDRVAKQFQDAGAHASIRSISELPALLDSIQQKGECSPHAIDATT
jgi:phosphonoacetaldehyde hydrolase